MYWIGPNNEGAPNSVFQIKRYLCIQPQRRLGVKECDMIMSSCLWINGVSPISTSNEKRFAVHIDPSPSRPSLTAALGTWLRSLLTENHFCRIEFTFSFVRLQGVRPVS